MLDHATLIRRCLITALKEDASVAAAVGTRVHDQVSANPVWDFIRLDPPTMEPYESSCGRGFIMEWRIHLFARGPGTEAVNDLGSKVFHVVCETELSIPELNRFDIDFVRSNTGPDGEEPNDYHSEMVFTSTSTEE